MPCNGIWISRSVRAMTVEQLGEATGMDHTWVPYHIEEARERVQSDINDQQITSAISHLTAAQRLKARQLILAFMECNHGRLPNLLADFAKRAQRMVPETAPEPVPPRTYSTGNHVYTFEPFVCDDQQYLEWLGNRTHTNETLTDWIHQLWDKRRADWPLTHGGLPFPRWQ